MKTVKAELERMEKLGVISRVSEPTEWCIGVVVPKPNGQVYICIIADMLSRAPVTITSSSDHLFHQVTNVSVEIEIQSLPASGTQLERIRDIHISLIT